MLGIGETELVIIVVFAFLLFGPDKLPGMGRTLGRVLRQFREASDGFSEVVQTNIMDPAAEELEKSPKQRRREEAAREAAEAEAGGTASDDEAPRPRRETFAERKARLAAERKAAEAEAATAEGAFAGVAHETSDAAGEAADEAPVARAADLYGTRARSSRSRAAAAQAKPEAAQPAPAPAGAPTDEGEGDGNDEPQG